MYDRYLSTSKDENEIRKGRAEADYAPYTNYANAVSKTAYGQYAPAQALATFLASPAANQLNPKQLEALAAQMQVYSQQPGMSGNIPLPNSNSGGNIFGEILKSFLPKSNNAMNQTPGSQVQQQQQQPVAQQSTSNTQMAPPNVPNQPTIPPPTQQPGGIMSANQLFGTGAYGRQASGASIPGSVGGINPTSGAAATAAGLTAGVTAEANNETSRMDKMINNDNSSADAVPRVKSLLDKAKDARKRLNIFQKGNVGGRLPAMSTAANDYDQTMASIVTEFSKADSQGNLTNMGRQFAQDAKSPRKVDDESFDHMYEYTSGLQDRTSEKPLFNNTMKGLGYNSIQIPIMWNYYQTKRPFYDNKTHKMDEENINSWEDFYTNPKNVQAAFSPKAQKEMDKFLKDKGSDKQEIAKSTGNHTTQYVTLGDTKYHYVNGAYYK